MKNKQQFEEMKKKLKDTIKMKDYVPDKFQIFAWEAGLGKSKFSTEFVGEVILESIGSKNVPKFLIVKKFKSDVENTVMGLKSSSIVNMYGEDAIVGITSDNWKYWR